MRSLEAVPQESTPFPPDSAPEDGQNQPEGVEPEGVSDPTAPAVSPGGGEGLSVEGGNLGEERALVGMDLGVGGEANLGSAEGSAELTAEPDPMEVDAQGSAEGGLWPAFRFQTCESGSWVCVYCQCLWLGCCCWDFWITVVLEAELVKTLGRDVFLSALNLSTLLE